MRRPTPGLAALAVLVPGLVAALAATAGGDVGVVLGAALMTSIFGAGVSWVLVSRTAREHDRAQERVLHLMREVEDGKARFTDALVGVGSVLGSTHDRASIVEVLTETMALLTHARAVVFWAPTRDRFQARVMRGQVDGVADDAVGADTLVGRSGGGCVVVEGTPGPGEPSAPLALALPLSNSGRLYGVITVYLDTALDPPVRITAELLVAQAEVALSNTFLHEEARNLAITDGLTGVWNRREFDIRVANEAERAARFDQPFAVMLADLDHFKKVNDTHGHQVGDAVLIEAAQVFKRMTRDVDVVARYGGEEFALILPNTDADGAAGVAEKLRREVEAEEFGLDDVRLAVTVSLGVAMYPHHGQRPAELVAAADRALYRAKRTRNSVCVADPTLDL